MRRPAFFLLLALGAWTTAAAADPGTLAVGRSTPYEVQKQVKELLDDDAYGFCHDEDYPLEDAARDYCDLVEDPSTECPRFADACKNDARPPPGRSGGVASGRGIPRSGSGSGAGSSGSGSSSGSSDARQDDGRADLGRTVRRKSEGQDGDGDGDGDGSGSSGSGGKRAGHGSGSSGSSGHGSGDGDRSDGGGDGDGDGDGNGDTGGKKKGGDKPPSDTPDESEPKKAEPPEPPPEDTKIEVPSFLAVIFKFLFFAIVAGVVGYVIYLIVKNVMKGRDKDAPEEEEAKATEDAASPVQAPRGPIETDVDRLLNRARAAAQRGDHKAAIEDTYAALLRRLEGDGLVDLHPSRTNGDYVRSLRDRPELKGAVRSVADDVERVQFGTEAPSPTLFDTVWRKVLPLVGRSAILLALLGAALSASPRSADAADASDDAPTILAAGGRSTPGTGPMERKAVEAFLTESGVSVTRRRDDKTVELDTKRAIVVLPDATIDAKVWRRLLKFSKEDGGTVIVVGHRDFLSTDLSLGFAPSQGTTAVEPSLDGPSALYGLHLRLPPAGALVRTPGTQVREVLSRSGETYAADRRFPGGGRVVVFADDALFTNVALAAGDNAAFLSGFVKDLGVDKLELWDAFTGAGAATPFESVAQAHLTPIIAQLLALILLYLVYRGARFGTPRDPKAASRRAFADHARALGATYARAKASRHAAGLYALWALDRLRERLQRTGRRGLVPLAEAIAARTGRPIGDVTRVLVEATGARDEVAPPSSFRGSEHVEIGRNPAQDDFSIMRELDGFLSATTTGAAAAPKARTPGNAASSTPKAP